MTRQTTTTRIRRSIAATIGATALLLMLSGCAELLSMFAEDPLNSKEQIDALEDTLNEVGERSRSNLSDHLHPDVPSSFNDPQVWQQVFQTDAAYTFNSVTASSETGPDGLSLYTATISAEPDDGSAPVTDAIHDATITFGMERDTAGDDSSMVRTISISNHDLGTEFEDPYEFIPF